MEEARLLEEVGKNVEERRQEVEELIMLEEAGTQKLAEGKGWEEVKLKLEEGKGGEVEVKEMKAEEFEVLKKEQEEEETERLLEERWIKEGIEEVGMKKD